MTQNPGKRSVLEKSGVAQRCTSVIFDWKDFSFEFDLEGFCCRLMLKIINKSPSHIIWPIFVDSERKKEFHGSIASHRLIRLRKDYYELTLE